VKRKQVYLTSLIFLFAISTLLIYIPAAHSQDILYHVDKQWVKMWVNTDDGSVDLFYNITISCDQDSFRTVTIGMPNPSFNVGWSGNQFGNDLDYEYVSSGDYSGLKVTLDNEIFAGESATILVLTRVDRMVWEHNETFVGVAFTPTWWDAEVYNLRVDIVLPSGVEQDEFGCKPAPCDNYFFDPAENNQLVVYWERYNLPSNMKIEFGASFPKEYVDYYNVEDEFPLWFFIISLVIIFLVIVLIIVFLMRRRRTYEAPKLGVEALGPRRGLTAVEAAMVLGLKPMKVLTMILFGLLLKKAVWIESIEPRLKVRTFRESEGKKMRSYEIDFMKAIQSNGFLDDKILARTYVNLRDKVDVKIRGYSREDTVKYYKSIVGKAWKQIKDAETPQLKAEALDENILWLLSDKEYDKKFKGVFDPTSTITIRPNWYWYWYGWHYPRHTGEKPSGVDVMPAVDFANSVVTMVEKASGRLVSDIEKFVDKLIPQQRKQTAKPIHHRATCACACASCACACACVSCACACAGGGVGK
jgi:hypothetical protein